MLSRPAPTRATTAPDSLGTPDPLSFSLPDSLAAPDSLALRVTPAIPDSARSAPRSPRLQVTPAVHAELSAHALARGHDGTLRESLPWATSLARIPSGSYYEPDPIDWGDLPGREPIGWLEEGVPFAAPSHPETPPDPLGPLWARRAVLRPGDPLTWPNQPTAGPLVEWELVRPDSSGAESGVRLTSATNETHTEEFVLARPVARGTLGLYYGDHKTAGRILSLGEKSENLAAHFVRPLRWGHWKLSGRHHRARSRLFPNERFLFDLSGLEGALVAEKNGWEIDAQLGVAWQRLAFEEAAAPKRKDAWTRAIVRLAAPPREAGASSLRPRLTVEWDATRVRYHEAGVLALDRRPDGVGFAAGVDGVTAGWRFRGSAGRAAFATDRTGAIWAFEASRRLAGAGLSLAARRGVHPHVEPRLALELGSFVRQDLVRPEVDASRPLDALTQVEAGVVTAGDRRVTARLSARVARWEGEVAPERIDVVSARGGLDARMGRRIEAEVRAVVRRSDPGWREQLWATPWETWGTLSWRHRLFHQRLDARLFLRARVQGERSTPYGRIASSDRYDGGGDFELGAATFYFMLANLEDDFSPAAGYDGGFMLLPYRSFRMGLTWRFLD